MKADLSALKYMSLVTEVGMMMAIPIVGSIWLGNYIDKRVGTKFIFTLIFTLLGVALAFRNLYKLALRDDILDKKKDK